MGIESDDPAASALRAERLLAPVLPRIRQPEEAELSSVAAPDGTAIFFCRTSADDNSWTADFAPTGNPVRTDGLVTMTDRVSLTESIDDFDEAAIFYRSVLGLHAAETIELAAPSGLIRSRDTADGTGAVRITLNAAQLRRGDWAPAVPSPQHVVFATNDAFASAETMRALGVPPLKMPDNYYDDLDARFALPPERLEAMRQHSILYDRDGEGEYLHFFTEMLGSRVFFEVAQRIGGYTGFGDASGAPVRRRLIGNAGS